MKHRWSVQNSIALAAASLSAWTSLRVTAESCAPGPSGPPPGPDVVVMEHDGSARVWLERNGEDTVAGTLDYFTVDGPASFPGQPARVSVDYVSQRGTVSFAVGQRLASVDIPILDNGLLDRPRDFTIMIADASLGEVAGPLVRIEDNELGAALDPLFVPELWDQTRNELRRSTPLPMPDGRLLVPDPPWVTGGAGWQMLFPDGSRDGDFTTTFADTVLASFRNIALWPLRVLDDGRILASAVRSNGSNAATRGLVRLLPTGALDMVVAIPGFSGIGVA